MGAESGYQSWPVSVLMELLSPQALFLKHFMTTSDTSVEGITE
jgi:hypothetical protein